MYFCDTMVNVHIYICGLTRHVQVEQRSLGGMNLSPFSCTCPRCSHVPVHTGQHSPGERTGRLQGVSGQDTGVHDTLPFYTHTQHSIC